MMTTVNPWTQSESRVYAVVAGRVDEGPCGHCPQEPAQLHHPRLSTPRQGRTLGEWTSRGKLQVFIRTRLLSVGIPQILGSRELGLVWLCARWEVPSAV